MKLILYSLLAIFFITSCSDSENNNERTAQLSIRLTDAPIDDSKVEACFVTVSEIYLDGQLIEGYSTTTVDLLAYQNGNTFFLGDFDIQAENYSTIELKLQSESNDMNLHPHGCYILDADGKAHSLTESDITVSLNTEINVEEEGSKEEIVFDFDLRKCIQAKDDSEDQYDFVGSGNLNSAIRICSMEDGHIKGECNAMLDFSDEIIVYVYKKGTFNEASELQVDSETQLQFSNAVSSSKVNSESKFQLSFLEEGEYELHFFGYEKEADGNLKIKGKLEVQSQTDLLDLTSLSFNSQTDLELNVLIIGIG